MWVVRALLIFVISAVITACMTDAQPPPIGDSDGGIDNDGGVVDLAPCAKPNPGCGCGDAGAGAKVSCGNVYRYSGTYLTCSPGYITCGTNEVWGDCVGDSVFDGN